MTITHEDLERGFQIVIENYRKRAYSDFQKEALFAHAFFQLSIGEPFKGEGPNDRSFSELPFDKFWIVTNYKGLAVCAFVENAHVDDTGNGSLNFQWFWSLIPGQVHRASQAEVSRAADILIFRALAALHANTTEAVESPVQGSINRGRAKTIGKASYIPAMPAFIRITRTPKAPSDPQGGTHASPIPHDRRGHWRTYRASGKRVWINNSKVLGGSQVPRNYLMA